MGDIQEVQPARRRGRDDDPKETAELPGAGLRVGRVPHRPGDQRPRRAHRHGSRGEGHRHGHPLPQRADREDAGDYESGESEQRPADEAVALRQRHGGRQPRQKSSDSPAQNRAT